MRIGKYITNLGVIGSLIGMLGVVRKTKTMPPDWRRYVVWAVWLFGLVLSVADVAKQEQDELYNELR